MTTGKLEYYAARSGLSAGTLDDHMFAFFASRSGLPQGTLGDHMRAFFAAGSGLPAGSALSDHMRAFYQAQTGSSSSSLNDLQAAFFANPPSGGVVAGTTPVILPAARTFSYNNVADSGTQMTLTPNANTQLGDVLVAVITGTTSPTTVTPVDAGWTSVVTKATAGSLTSWVFWRRRGLGETTYRFTYDSGGGNTVGALYALARAADPAVIGAVTNRSVDLTNVAKSITTLTDNALALALSMERTTATETGITSKTAGWTELGFAQQAGSAIQTIWGGYKTQATAGATGDCTIVYPNTQTTNGHALQLSVPPKSLAARVTDIAHWAAQPNAFIAHRGGSKNFPEMTKFAYDESVFYGMNAIEISVWSSAAGTFWCIHDNDLTIRTNGTGNVTAASDATLAGLSVNAGATSNTGQVARPLSKLADVLAAYGDNVIVFIEAKSMYTIPADAAALATIIQAQPHWKDRFIWKQSGTATVNAARPTGIKTWGYFFDTDMAGSFSSKQAQFDYVGLDYASSDATLTSAIAAAGASRVIAHILTSSAQVTRFQGLGVHKFMCADISLAPAA